MGAGVPGVRAEKWLVVGGALAAEIRGGNNAGWPWCWFNPNGLAAPEDLRIDHIITDLLQLPEIV